MTALGFTPAKGQDIYWIDEREKSSLLPTAISGAEARSFYEGLVGDADGGSVNPGTGTRTGTRGPTGGETRRSGGRSRVDRGHTGRPGRGRPHGGPPERVPPSGGRPPRSGRTGLPSGDPELLGLRLLRCAQEGDLSGLKDLLSRGVDINFQVALFIAMDLTDSVKYQKNPTMLKVKMLKPTQWTVPTGRLLYLSYIWVDTPTCDVIRGHALDCNFNLVVDLRCCLQDTFFWTAMMCASWAGQRATVRLLLGRGAAWVGVVDTRGRDARELAHTAGHQGVVEELDGFETNTQQVTQPDRSVPERHWCKMCGSHFSGRSSSHLSSTLHQFSLRRQPPTPQYCLPASSASYKMMVRCGWDPRTGLGPDGGGPKQPVSTVLKRDHQGLGYGPIKRARVTHFPAKDPRAVKPPRAVEREGRVDKGKRKEESRRKQETDRNWERDFRTSFNL
ncbi:G patch domain and ankyrin repeat-containing protein 1 [Merluccius polli]|uniref:G patch domain and ankyrin repeat-containing protein 1 n=1 Tax=Merluccius polli TaxID=89951 RepID=A0AA47MR37_MERPO|nr:G patch domain and ankyrin repeat-containing protein 1 [Merluccius polli]